MFNHLQTFPNLCENLYLMSLMLFFNLKNPKMKTHNFLRNKTPFKTFKTYAFGTKKLKKQKTIVTHMDM
jgi:hypothetical protein